MKNKLPVIKNEFTINSRLNYIDHYESTLKNSITYIRFVYGLSYGIYIIKKI
jgi:hypothetical protein